MSTIDKKRKAGDAFESMEEEMKFLREENERLHKKVVSLTSELASYEEAESSDDDDDDDDSVCDGSPWSKNYFLLKQYKAKNGDCKVPKSVPKLGSFVDNARTSYKKGKMPQARLEKLNKIGFYWGKGFPEPKGWDGYFKELQEKIELTGNPDIYIDRDTSKMTELAKWVVEQRKQGRRLFKGKPTKMSKEQYKKLDGVGFKWKGSRPRS